jgi:hypothetical protein
MPSTDDAWLCERVSTWPASRFLGNNVKSSQIVGRSRGVRSDCRHIFAKATRALSRVRTSLSDSGLDQGRSLCNIPELSCFVCISTRCTLNIIAIVEDQPGMFPIHHSAHITTYSIQSYTCCTLLSLRLYELPYIIRPWGHRRWRLL